MITVQAIIPWITLAGFFCTTAIYFVKLGKVLETITRLEKDVERHEVLIGVVQARQNEHAIVFGRIDEKLQNIMAMLKELQKGHP